MPSLSAHNWSIHYEWSTSSGLVVGPCDYLGHRVFYDLAVPFVFVNYSGDAFGPFTDQLRSTSQKVDRREIMNGIDLRASYDLYSDDYLYEHVIRFHDDGQFASRIVIQGPGEENQGQHVYHIPFRIDLDVGGADHDSLQQRGPTGEWFDVASEGGYRPVYGVGPEWRVSDSNQSRSVLMTPGAFDASELWALAYKEAEGWSAIGGATEVVPGAAGGVPAIYDTDESVQDADLVLWYIAHIPSTELPRACGPWFAVAGYGQQAPPPIEHHHE